jgi:1-acyl-sn-glycerol-3-phosphate acyltransferase
MHVGYSLAKSIVGFYKELFLRDVELFGSENILPSPKIIICNHAYATDPFVLPFIFKERLHFMIQDSLFRAPLIGFLLSFADQLPVVAGRGRQLIRQANQYLTQGDSVVIFPEGVLNHGKEFLPARGGAALLAAYSGYPVQPVGFYTPPEYVREIRLEFEKRPGRSMWQFGGPTFVNVGAGMSINKSEKSIIDPHLLIDQMMLRIQTLVGEVETRWNTIKKNYTG